MGTPQIDAAQMMTFKKSVSILGQPTTKEEVKMEALRGLTENYELILQSGQFQSFLDHSVKIFCKVLQEDEPQFLAESLMQQVTFYLDQSTILAVVSFRPLYSRVVWSVE